MSGTTAARRTCSGGASPTAASSMIAFGVTQRTSTSRLSCDSALTSTAKEPSTTLSIWMRPGYDRSDGGRTSSTTSRPARARAAATNAPIPPGPKTAWRNISEPDAGHVGVLARVLGLKAVALLRAVAATAAHRNRFRLAPEPRPATDTEPLLQRPVLLPILQRCPDEQATDKNGGRNGNEQNKNDRGRGVHASKSFPPEAIS